MRDSPSFTVNDACRTGLLCVLYLQILYHKFSDFYTELRHRFFNFVKL